MTTTPWGKSHQVQHIVQGINFYSTPSHGGYHVSPTMLRKMPLVLLNADGWYEEDCEWAKVVLAFPKFFPDKVWAEAKSTLRAWFPDIYEALFQEVISPGNSLVKDDRSFLEKHKDDFIAIAAWLFEGGQVKVLAARGGDRSREMKYFLVSEEEYKPGNFLIIPSRHVEVKG